MREVGTALPERPACVNANPEIFFTFDADEIPDAAERRKTNGRNAVRAQALCDACPLRQKCLEDNLLEPYGIFGGMGAKPRHALARSRGLEPKQPDVDWVVVERLVDGIEVPEANKAERKAAMKYLMEHGYSRADVAERLGLAGPQSVNHRTWAA